MAPVHDGAGNRHCYAIQAIALMSLSLGGPLCYFVTVGFLQRAGLKTRVGIGKQLFCEMKMPIGESFMCQKASGLSAFAYAAPAGVVAWNWKHLQQEEARQCLDVCSGPFNERSPENIAFMIACVYLVVGNLSMHGFCVPEGHRLDASSMTVIVCFLGAHAMQCGCTLVFGQGAHVTRWMFRGCLSVGVAGSLLLPDLCVLFACANGDHYAFAFLGVIGGGLSMLVMCEITAAAIAGVRTHSCSTCVHTFSRPHTAWGLTACAALAIGFYFQPGTGCSPQSWWQPHAVWHLFTAVAIQAMWFMMRKEPASAHVKK